MGVGRIGVGGVAVALRERNSGAIRESMFRAVMRCERPGLSELRVWRESNASGGAASADAAKKLTCGPPETTCRTSSQLHRDGRSSIGRSSSPKLSTSAGPQGRHACLESPRQQARLRRHVHQSLPGRPAVHVPDGRHQPDRRPPGPILEPDGSRAPRYMGLQFQLPDRDDVLTASGETVTARRRRSASVSRTCRPTPPGPSSHSSVIRLFVTPRRASHPLARFKHPSVQPRAPPFVSRRTNALCFGGVRLTGLGRVSMVRSSVVLRARFLFRRPAHPARPDLARVM